MPKSKVRSKTEYTDAAVSRTPVKVKGTPTGRWYLITMFALMLLGLLWLVVYYLAGEKIPFMMDLETWQNFAIGFGLAVVGLLMTMNWR
ncbi:cell division protein CrgA [Rhodococcus sp. IEGM 1408]|uniref:cell division protein CrgA n=1 Tax=Rhodococcus sp. IEGM 1408 TaxID=3082220 RepID=UPI002954CEB2|nr:cell division protein CrgA [Rhodococcus sp. IEGM 1408]MDV8000134.1 cell division protein CrgA [Rhodococcus sp. IEGM 1408]